MNRVVPAPDDNNAFMVVHGKTEQSWVALDDPLHLEFEYVQRIADVLEASIFQRPYTERLRVVHVGGGGMTLARYVEARRRGTAQIVLEPDVALIDEVRKHLPVPRASVKVRPVDGKTGVGDLPSGCADVVIIDAFDGPSVPAELATVDFFVQVRRVLRADGLAVMNLTDQAPFAWGRRCVAGLAEVFPELAVIGEVPIWKGRRFGNLIAVAGVELPIEDLTRRVARAMFPYRLSTQEHLRGWLGGATPFIGEDSLPSPAPEGRAWFS
ncbi:spermidine synthase [Propionicimonas paludicola]|uniref:Spermidine synthase n=1 Tax=Propionicimonas paludicola TaxID=185243 RepID=A0A2A9CNN3_9ACTN|nr:fused MFS/spermidine synthase [Propionicimonas paludicola]PFG15695.1 spermidine synthase [Propionicimonas paludicola]